MDVTTEGNGMAVAGDAMADGINEATTSCPVIDQWGEARQLLIQLLEKNNGCVSTTGLRRELERRGLENVGSLISRLRFYEPSEDESNELMFHHHGRSFYTEETYKEIENKTAQAAEESVTVEAETEDEEEHEKPKYRQDESRLCSYVRETLSDIYASDFGPDDAEYAFDVHKRRPGSNYENVDLIAADWRSNSIVELVAVEVKLDFTSKLIQQANNYARFADRVWIAVLIEGRLADAAALLRDYDALLFDYSVELGLGILACRRGRGNSYEIAPVQWPRQYNVSRVEREEFIERFREVFEEARVIKPQEQVAYPTFPN